MSQGPEAILRNLVWSRFSLAVAPMVFATQAEGLVYRCPNSIWAIKAQIPIMEQVFQTQKATFLAKSLSFLPTPKNGRDIEKETNRHEFASRSVLLTCCKSIAATERSETLGRTGTVISISISVHRAIGRIICVPISMRG
jgi:hypothetical protein